METVGLAKAVVAIIDLVHGWPGYLILFVFFVLPPLLLIYVIRNLVVAIVALREEVKAAMTEHRTKYDNNVILVENYEDIARELVSMVRLNTSAQTQLADLIRGFMKGNRGSN